MPVISMNFNEPAWPDLADKGDKVIDYQDPISATALPGGMQAGGTSIALRFDLPDGQIVIVQTSLAALNMLVRGVIGRYPDPPGVGMNAS
jgi:hypothetical protein